MRIAVTGARGFVGGHVARRLAADGHDVHLVVRPEVDLTDPKAVRDAITAAAPEVIVHAAWGIGPGYLTDVASNVASLQATLCLLGAALAGGVRRVVMTGTCVEHLPLPSWPDGPPVYVEAKEAAHRMLVAVERAGVSVTCAHLHTVYGPGENPSRLVPSVARSLLAGQRVAVGSGEDVREWVHVDDAAAAIALLAVAARDGGAPRWLDVCAGETATTRQVIELVAELTCRPDLVGWGERTDPPLLPAVIIGDPEPLAALGWAPRFDLRTGIADAVAWWRDELGSGGLRGRDGALEG